MRGQSFQAYQSDKLELLGVERSASQAQIKKAYHKASHLGVLTDIQAALRSHPDKVAPEKREEAEVEFKAISQAFDILHNDETRELYDRHGMAAFEKGSGGMGAGAGADMDDILAQMFGFGMGGGMPGGPRRPNGRQRGEDEEQEYQVTLEELFKGKTTHFSSTKNVICSQCNGSGAKDKAKPKQCDTCKGRGAIQKLQPVGPGLVTQVMAKCSTCNGSGSIVKDKDRCKKCKGQRTIQTKKVLELYVPPGSREGEKIILAGEADQLPDQEPGDIVFHLVEAPHKIFRRAGPDLAADLEITLAEALTGFERVVLTHLDGRGIQLAVQTETDLPLEPGQCIRIRGEGMPVKRSDTKGDLYLTVNIRFPPKGFLAGPKGEEEAKTIINLLSGSVPLVDPAPAEVDAVLDVDLDVDSEEFGGNSDDPRRGAEWQDDEDDGPQAAQCAQQ